MALSPHELLRVLKPARYVGGELGSVKKDHREVSLTFALAFPDVYEIAMSHLGCQILYAVLNSRDDIACERVHAPWPDYAALLEEKGLPLHSLESGTPVGDFDVLGFSLQVEASYTTVLWMLRLAGLPLRSSERVSGPIVIAGGPCCVNPEPMAPFIDAFVIGDGEEVVLELADRLIASRGEASCDRIRSLAAIQGVYVPALYDVAAAPGGWSYVIGAREAAPWPVRRRLVRDLDAAPYPLEPIVPHIEAIHDRATLEIARGCTRGCRFCQAGMIDRPVRNRSVGALQGQASAILSFTGHEELGLLSLSAADHPEIGPLCDLLVEAHAARGIDLSLPSTRVDSLSVGLADRVAQVRKSGITLAPEAGTPRLRDVINKQVTDEDIMAAASAAFDAGFSLIKLYFMIGLPSETDEDAEGIVRIIRRIVGLATSRGIKRGTVVTTSLAAFIPKPHTPFQWSAQADGETLERRRRIVTDALRKERRADVSWSDPATAQLECLLARGGRELAPAIEAAFCAGAKLDGWDEFADTDRWIHALASAGVPPVERTGGLPENGPLPWDHIHAGVDRAFLLREAERARSGELTPDCGGVRCYGCGAGCQVAG